MRLLSNPSVLGKKLLEYVENGLIDDLPAAVSVEVFVKAHDCFTLSSDVEGISNVLRKVKHMVTQRLLEKNDFHSMIRLLKGIGRYSEMTYIFDILKDNDAFELLLGKGIEKVPQLRVALLDSVKSDKETFTMIALNFSMHREIAEMMESSAMKTIKSVQLRRQQSQMSFKTILERVLEEMIDASESYTKAGCYTKADLCAKRAELIALQINYLPSGLVILNLTETAVADFVSKHHKFAEALIVADAYQHQRSWDQALFNLVVLHGDWNYFRDYSLQIKLTTTNFEEIIALYTKYKNNNFLTLSSDKQTSVNNNLQRLLTHLPDLRQQYQYCMLLDFHEMANNLLHGENGAFLRDLKRLQQI
ncbi:spatacsin-like protein, partial [Leptotrombidium deliense]